MTSVNSPLYGLHDTGGNFFIPTRVGINTSSILNTNALTVNGLSYMTSNCGIGMVASNGYALDVSGTSRVSVPGTGVTCGISVSAGMTGSASLSNVARVQFITKGGGGGTVTHGVSSAYNGTDYMMSLNTGGSNCLNILESNGYVGIGKIPSVMLDVNGTVAMSGGGTATSSMYPPTYMTGLTYVVGTNTRTVNSYTVSCSSPWNADIGWIFDGTCTDRNFCSINNYSPTYTGSTTTTGGYLGEWIQIQMPTAIYLTSINIYSRVGNCVSSCVVLGSANGGTSWMQIGSFFNLNTGTAATIPIVLSSTTNRNSLSLYRVVFTGGLGGYCSLNGIEFYGQAPPPYALDVNGPLNVNSSLSVNSSLYVNGPLSLNAPLTVNSSINITGNNPLYFNAWGGGFYMQDATWIRAMNNKNLYTLGLVGGEAGFYSGGSIMKHCDGTYGNMQITDGGASGWNGIYFPTGGANMTLMMGTTSGNTTCGFHHNGVGWKWRTDDNGHTYQTGGLYTDNYGWITDAFAYKAGSTGQNFYAAYSQVDGGLSTAGNTTVCRDSSQFYVGGNRTGNYMRWQDDVWIYDPQNGGHYVCNGGGAQWGTLTGYLNNASSRNFKKGIRELSAYQKQQLYEDAIAVQVKSWWYTSEDVTTFQMKYGPILEECPAYFAGGPDKSSLFMPCYVAMLHAAFQVSVENITNLETNVAALQADVAELQTVVSSQQTIIADLTIRLTNLETKII